MKFITTIILLSLSLSTQGQGVINPPNFVNYNSTLQDEHIINVSEINGGGYLFSMTLNIPYNTVSDENYSSAKLVKTDINGVVLASFTIAHDINTRRIYRGMNAFIHANEILFFVARDSSVYNDESKHTGIFIYHLNKLTLSLNSVDSFLNLLPQNSSIANWSFAPTASAIYCCLSYQNILSSSSLSYYNVLVKVNIQNNQCTTSKYTFNSQNIPGMFQNGLNLVTKMELNPSSDSIGLFMTSADSISNQQIYRYVLADTALTGLHAENFFNGSYQYAPNKIVETTTMGQGMRITPRKILLGSEFINNSNRTIGVLRYDIVDMAYDKVLFIPDSSFSFHNKLYCPFETIANYNNKIFCLGSDFSFSGNVFYNNNANHLYVGKTDTSLNNWQWYKYIGNNQFYQIPYKILATADGGCLITTGIYDHVNNQNLEHDVYIIKLSSAGLITSVSNLTPTVSKSVLLYPVPAQETLFLSYNGSAAYSLTLYDALGKVVLQKNNINSSRQSISIGNLADGNYIYEIRFGNGRKEQGKLIKKL